MKKTILSIAFAAILLACQPGRQHPSEPTSTTPAHVVKIKMHLSAFGVESDRFPSIEAVIDFEQDTSLCVKSYFHPDYPGSTYRLTKAEMDSIQHLLQKHDLKRLKPSYREYATDQPRSTTQIYTTREVFEIDDYGLVGDAPLGELYGLVYRY